MPSGLSYAELMKVPFILKLIRRIHAPGSTICNYYGLGITPSVPVQGIVGRAGQYDIFDGTRSLAPFTAPGAPPVDINRKPVGTQPITVPRQYNKIGIEDEQIFGTRNLGQPYSQPVPSRGEQYMTNQIRYLKTRMNNNHEYMAAAMFQGGFNLKPYAAGSSLLVLSPKATVAGEITNDSLVPTSHQGNIGGIIGTSWDDPAANLVDQLMDLQVQAARENGRRLTEIWVNGTTGKHLFTNNVIQAVGGSVYRIFDTLNPSQEITSPDQKFPDTGVTVKFRGLPDYNFHIYNQGYVTPGTSESFSAQINSSNWKPFIPDNQAFITPSPGEWLGMVEGSEPMQWNLREARSQIVQGFGMGTERAIDPPRSDVKMLYNGAPVITEPYAVYNPTVIF